MPNLGENGHTADRAALSHCYRRPPARAQCPHLLDKGVTKASPEVIATRDVCVICQKELAGEGRTEHATIEGVLEDFGAPQHARAELARLLREVDFDKVHVPFSRSYVAVTRHGRAVAWAGKTFVGYSDRPIVTLLDYAPGGGRGTPGRDDQWGAATCPRCHTRKSITGACLCG